MFGRYGSLLGVLLIAAPCSAWAGAWTLENGKGQLTVNATVSQARKAFDDSRHSRTTPRYTKFELQGLFEYGVTDRLTAMFAPSLQHIDIAFPTDASRSGLGYTDVGARFRFLQSGSWVFSGQALMRIPGTGDGANPAAVGYTDPELEMRALLGYSFDLQGLPTFVNFEAAQRFRFGDPPDEFRIDATFGLRPVPQWLLLAQSFNVISEGAGRTAAFPTYDYSKLQLSAVYSVTPSLSLQFGLFTTFSGRNALQENGLVSGLWYYF